MGGCLARVARIAALVVGLVSINGIDAGAQEVIPDSYIVTYKAQALHAIGASALASSVNSNELSLGHGAAEIRSASAAPGAVDSLGIAAAHAPEMFGRKQIDFCNQLVTRRDDIASCSPNWVVRASAVPSDPRLSSLWGLTGTNGVAASSAWDTTTGSDDVVVAIIDTGIDYTHQDLAANVWVNPLEIPDNGIDDDGNGVVDDVHGVNYSGNGRPVGDPFDDNSHGTHVAGTIGAIGNNGVGVVGVNWHVKIMALKFLGANGSGSTSAAIQALNYLIDLKSRGINVKVVNNSWGGGGDSPALREAIQRSGDAGILFTAAAGNSGQNIEETPQYPAAYSLPNMLKVAAIDRDGNLAYFSNYGARLVDIAAPGVDILSTVPGNQYASYSGTSMATPHVTGVAALYLSNHPDASVAEIKDAILSGGRDLASVTGLVASGRTLDAQRAVLNVSVPVAAPVAECPYTIATQAFAADTASDGKRPVITSDEDGFYKVALPFSFPFEGQYRESIYLSPNGVVYFGGRPTGWDNRNQSTAPSNAIAALHTDLYPEPQAASGLGVRVATSSSKVTVSWKARVYDRQSQNEQVVVRLTLYPTGTIDIGYSISSAGLQSALATATIGVKGSALNSSSTYEGEVADGLRLRMTPGCLPTSTVGTHVQTVSAAGVVNRHERSAAIAGSRIVIRGKIAGQGTVQLIGRIDGKRCTDSDSIAVSETRIKRIGQVPYGVVAKRISFALVGDDGQSRVAALRIRTNAKRSAARRANSVRTSCELLMNSFN